MKTHVEHYEIIEELGRGGMGVVYKGYEPTLARYVAIKELSPALAHSPQVVERFLREARAMAMLNNAHILQIYYIGPDQDHPFFVMEFVDGASVAGLIKLHGTLSPGDALKIVHQTAKGLALAHEHGVIHRDIKPANLLINYRGELKIGDFGIALASNEGESKLTNAGELVGTPGYLAPEILLGQPVDLRADVYALGVVLFEMLTGRTPFSEASVYKLMLEVVQNEVPDVREINADIDPGVAAILARMLAKAPEARYPDMAALISDLEKHPLVARGGAIEAMVALRARVGDDGAARTPSGATPRPRTPTPAPAAAAREAAPALPTGVARPPGAGAETQVRTLPGFQVTPAKKVSRFAGKGKWIAAGGGALALLLVALWWGGGASSPTPSDSTAAPPIADSASATGAGTGKKLSAAAHKAAEALREQKLLEEARRKQAEAEGVYSKLRAAAIDRIGALLRVLGVKISPAWIYNGLLLLIGYSVVMRLYTAYQRWRTTRRLSSARAKAT